MLPSTVLFRYDFSEWLARCPVVRGAAAQFVGYLIPEWREHEALIRALCEAGQMGEGWAEIPRLFYCFHLSEPPTFLTEAVNLLRVGEVSTRLKRFHPCGCGKPVFGQIYCKCGNALTCGDRCRCLHRWWWWGPDRLCVHWNCTRNKAAHWKTISCPAEVTSEDCKCVGDCIGKAGWEERLFMVQSSNVDRLKPLLCKTIMQWKGLILPYPKACDPGSLSFFQYVLPWMVVRDLPVDWECAPFALAEELGFPETAFRNGAHALVHFGEEPSNPGEGPGTEEEWINFNRRCSMMKEKVWYYRRAIPLLQDLQNMIIEYLL